MVNFDPATLHLWIIGFFVVAALGAALAAGAVAELLWSNHRTRIARHQSVPAYYRGLATGH
jgi:hypothetical protein